MSTSAERSCNRCRGSVALAARFCGHCGQSLEAEDSAGPIVTRKVVALFTLIVVGVGAAAYVAMSWYLAHSGPFTDRLLATAPADVSAPMMTAFSPDGRDVAYTAKRGQRVVVIHKDVRSQEYDEVSELELSPDAVGPVYAARRGESWFQVREGREGPPVPGATKLSRPQFSADGRHSWYIDAARAISRVVTDGRPGPAMDGWPRLMSTNRARTTLTYVAVRNGAAWITVGDRELGPFEQVTQLAFAEDDSSVLFTARRDGHWHVFKETKSLETEPDPIRLVFDEHGEILTSFVERATGLHHRDGRPAGFSEVRDKGVGPPARPSIVGALASGLATVVTDGKPAAIDAPGISLDTVTADGRPVYVASVYPQRFVVVGEVAVAIDQFPRSTLIVNQSGSRVGFGAVVGKQIHWKTVDLPDTPTANAAGHWFALRRGVERHGFSIGADGTLSHNGQPSGFRVPAAIPWLSVSPTSPNASFRLLGLGEDNPSVILDLKRNIASTLPTDAPVSHLSWGPGDRALVITTYEQQERLLAVGLNPLVARHVSWPDVLSGNGFYFIDPTSINWADDAHVRLRLDVRCSYYGGSPCEDPDRLLKTFDLSIDTKTLAVEGRRSDVPVPDGARQTVERFYDAARRGDISACRSLLSESDAGKVERDAVEGLEIFKPMFTFAADRTVNTLMGLMVADDRAIAEVVTTFPDYTQTGAGRQLGADLFGWQMSSGLGALAGVPASDAKVKSELQLIFDRFVASAQHETPSIRQDRSTCSLQPSPTGWRVGLDCGPRWITGWKLAQSGSRR